MHQQHNMKMRGSRRWDMEMGERVFHFYGKFVAVNILRFTIYIYIYSVLTGYVDPTEFNTQFSELRQKASDLWMIYDI